MVEKYNLIVIGAGPAGEKDASKAAQYGKRVARIERAPYLGGAGINTGSVPSKTLRETTLHFSGLQQRSPYGIDYFLRKNARGQIIGDMSGPIHIASHVMLTGGSIDAFIGAVYNCPTCPISPGLPPAMGWRTRRFPRRRESPSCWGGTIKFISMILTV